MEAMVQQLRRLLNLCNQCVCTLIGCCHVLCVPSNNLCLWKLWYSSSGVGTDGLLCTSGAIRLVRSASCPIHGASSSTGCLLRSC